MFRILEYDFLDYIVSLNFKVKVRLLTSGQARETILFPKNIYIYILNNFYSISKYRVRLKKINLSFLFACKQSVHIFKHCFAINWNALIK